MNSPESRNSALPHVHQVHETSDTGGRVEPRSARHLPCDCPLPHLSHIPQDGHEDNSRTCLRRRLPAVMHPRDTKRSLLNPAPALKMRSLGGSESHRTEPRIKTPMQHAHKCQGSTPQKYSLAEQTVHLLQVRESFLIPGRNLVRGASDSPQVPSALNGAGAHLVSQQVLRTSGSCGLGTTPPWRAGHSDRQAVHQPADGGGCTGLALTHTPL